MSGRMIVTQDGKPVYNQGLGIRLFKDAASKEVRYRVVYAAFGWIIYHCGYRIVDTREMQRGASDPGVLIDQVKAIRKRAGQ